MLGYTFVTPQMAEAFLNKNTFNRPLRSGQVERYARDMAADRWLKNGATIVFMTDGTLLDGQHRLFAIIEAACMNPNFKGVYMIIVRDADREALSTIDTGLARSYADYKKLEAGGTGHTFPYPNLVAAVLRLAFWYETAWPKIQIRSNKVSHQELDMLLEKHPQFPELIGDIGASDKLKRLGGGTTTAFVYATGGENFPNEARAWLEILKHGDAEKTHPAMVLRQQLIDKALAAKVVDQPTRLVWTIKSWNAFAQGEDIGRIRWGLDEPMPAIYGTKQYTGSRAGHTALTQMRQKPDLTPHEKGTLLRTGVRKRRRRPKAGQ